MLCELVRQREPDAELPQSRVQLEKWLAVRDGKGRPIIRLVRDHACMALEVPRRCGQQRLLFLGRKRVCVERVETRGESVFDGHPARVAVASEVKVTIL